MRSTNTVIVDGDSTPDPIVTDVPCVEVTVWSKDTDVTGGYDKYMPTASATPVRLADGEKAIFKAGPGAKFTAGAVVGYMKTVNVGPFTMNKECS
jgi:hypothetical protein